MARHANPHSLLACCLVFLANCSSAIAQIQQLANRVPSSANALIVINAKAAYSSPLAQAQNWNQTGAEAIRGGMIDLPARAEKILMAAEFDYEFMHPLWEVAVASVSELPEMRELANRSGAQLDRIAASQVFERPNDSVVVKLGPKVIGAWAPANRQQVSRWLRESHRRKSPELSEYLLDALGKANDQVNHIVLALDLQGLLAPIEVAETLTKKEAILDAKVNVKAYSGVIASLRGVRLEVRLQSPAQGRLTLDFEQDAGSLANFAKPLLLDVLSNNGLNVDDIQHWEVSAVAKSIILDGQLSPSGLRRILSVLSSPVGPLTTSHSSTGTSDDAVAVVSQEYFQTVVHYLDDLFFSDRRPNSLYEVKIWIQRYARLIEDLDSHQVDPEVVGFGQQVVDSLNEIVSVLDRAQKRSDLRESTSYAGRRRYGRYGTYGYFEKQDSLRDRQAIQAEEASRGLEAAHTIVEELRSLSAQTRQTMTERYKLAF